ncbi:MAG: hypothetical protein Q8P67_18305, partial [archaeon]|nr:hypothetical protein [archaeon]
MAAEEDRLEFDHSGEAGVPYPRSSLSIALNTTTLYAGLSPALHIDSAGLRASDSVSAERTPPSFSLPPHFQLSQELLSNPTAVPVADLTACALPLICQLDGSHPDFSAFDWDRCYQLLVRASSQSPRSFRVVFAMRKFLSAFQSQALLALSSLPLADLVRRAATAPSAGLYHHRASNLMVSPATSVSCEGARFCVQPWSQLLSGDATLESKMAAHQIKGIAACFPSAFLSLPLLALVDYAGFRFFVAPPVPLPLASLRTPEFNPSHIPLIPHRVGAHRCATNADVCLSVRQGAEF